MVLVACTACRNPVHTEVPENENMPDSSILMDDTLSTFELLLSKAQNEQKNLFMVFGFEKCGWCRIFSRYHHDPEVILILSKFFIVSEIDYDKTPDGKELYRTYGSTGFPSWVIMDNSGKVLISSEAPVPGVKSRTYNIGYPSKKDEMDYYIFAIRKAAPLITSSECEVLKNKISYYHVNN